MVRHLVFRCVSLTTALLVYLSPAYSQPTIRLESLRDAGTLYRITLSSHGLAVWRDDTDVWMAIQYPGLRRSVYQSWGFYDRERAPILVIRGDGGRRVLSLRFPTDDEIFPYAWFVGGGRLVVATYRGPVPGSHAPLESRSEHNVQAFDAVSGRRLFASNEHRCGRLLWTNGRALLTEYTDYDGARRRGYERHKRAIRQYLDVRDARTGRLVFRTRLPVTYPDRYEAEAPPRYLRHGIRLNLRLPRPLAGRPRTVLYEAER